MVGSKINDGMASQTSESALCTNGCGFFGTVATEGLCSKCYRDLWIEEERKGSAKNSVADCGVGPSQSVVSNRCSSCNKKVGMLGFRCRCGGTFCGVHRHAEKHGCTFDYKGVGRESISEANPVIKKDKMERI